MRNFDPKSFECFHVLDKSCFLVLDAKHRAPKFCSSSTHDTPLRASVTNIYTCSSHEESGGRAVSRIQRDIFGKNIFLYS